MIQAKNITFSHVGEPLYENASFTVSRNTKVGLVGLNGAGKSSLFNLIMREDYPEDGKIRVEGSVMLVRQEVSNDRLQKKFTTVREYLQSARTNADPVLRELLNNMELQNLSLDAGLKDLSGGQKTKLAILHAVLSEPDILLLDEPTNFLDEAGKKWVMHWLSKYRKTLVVVSHDLDLLDKHIQKVLYINKQTKQIEEFTGNYSKFKKLKAQHDRHLTRYIQNEEKRIKRMKASVEKLRRSNVDKVIRQRVLLEKRIQRIQDSLPQLPQELVKMKLQLPTPAHVGSVPVMVEGLSKRYGQKQVLKDVSFTIQRGERWALIGHNGAGKSTLIKSILGVIEPTSGEVLLDDQIQVGYYSQEFATFDLTKNLYDTVAEHTLMRHGQIRAFLASFMFSADALYQPVATLSGGEKTRLAIALLMLQDYNFLVLDEPTTYLDVLSQRIILEALKRYTGTMLVVSHTGQFLEELGIDKAILLPEEKVKFWESGLVGRSGEM